MTTTTNQPSGSEAEFLEAQAADAQAALHETWNDLKATMRETASLEVWAKRHPWVVTGAAVAGGFLLATMLFSPSEPAEPEASHDDDDNHDDTAPRPRRMAWLTGTLFNLLKPIFGQIVSSVIAAALGALGGSMAAASADGAPDGEMDGDRSMAGEGPVPT